MLSWEQELLKTIDFCLLSTFELRATSYKTLKCERDLKEPIIAVKTDRGSTPSLLDTQKRDINLIRSHSWIHETLFHYD